MTKSGSLKVKNLVALLKELRKEKETGVIHIKSSYGIGSVYLKDGKVAMATSTKSSEKVVRKVV